MVGVVERLLRRLRLRHGGSLVARAVRRTDDENCGMTRCARGEEVVEAGEREGSTGRGLLADPRAPGRRRAPLGRGRSPALPRPRDRGVVAAPVVADADPGVSSRCRRAPGASRGATGGTTRGPTLGPKGLEREIYGEEMRKGTSKALPRLSAPFPPPFRGAGGTGRPLDAEGKRPAARGCRSRAWRWRCRPSTPT